MLGKYSVVFVIFAGIFAKGAARVNPPLSKNVIPMSHHVSIEVEPDPTLGVPLIRGRVSIVVSLTQNTNTILLNSVAQTSVISAVRVNNVAASFTQVNTSFVSISTTSQLSSASQHTISLDYSVADTNCGIVRDNYTSTDGKEYWYTSTQGEQYTAHCYVPCFDDISMKTIWVATISHRKELTALSNGRLLQREPLANGYVRSYFEETPAMSSYLFTIAVSMFDKKSTMSKSGIPLTLYMNPVQMQNEGDNSLQYLKDAFDFVNTVLLPPYPLPKMDVIITPWFDDAMENWGLITGALNDIPDVIQHELAHQWFGDLVTPSSWSDLWLNEGFALYWEHQRFPNETINFQLDRGYITVATNDIGNKSQPFVSAVPNQSPAGFAMYEKGGCFLYMMDAMIGKANLWNVMNNYLQANAYKSVVTDDFFVYVRQIWRLQGGELAKIDIVQFQKDWTTQAGYPIISVTDTGSQYVLTQNSSSGNSDRWDVPLFLQSNDPCQDRQFVLKVFLKSQQSLTFTKASMSSSRKYPSFNIGFGLYRLEMSEDMFNGQAQEFQDDKYGCGSNAPFLRFLLDGTLSVNTSIQNKAKALLKQYFPFVQLDSARIIGEHIRY